MGRRRGGALAGDRFGVANAAFHFDGAGAYVEAGAALPEMDSTTVSLWLSLESWLQYQNWGAPQALFFEGDDGPGNDFGCLLQGGVHFLVKGSDALSYFNWMPPIGVWTHLVCVADVERDLLALWIDGRKAKEIAFPGTANRGFHAPFNLGRRPGGYNDWFLAGSLDEVRVYNRALTDLEIGELNAGGTVSTRSLGIEIETLRITMGLERGQRYILQSSADLVGWSDFGTAFVAAEAVESVSVTVDATRKFWRVVQP